MADETRTAEADAPDLDGDWAAKIAASEREYARARRAAREAAAPPTPAAPPANDPPQPIQVPVDIEGRNRPPVRFVRFPRRDGASDAAGYRARLRQRAGEPTAPATSTPPQGAPTPAVSPAIPPPATPLRARLEELFAGEGRRDG